MAEKVYFGVPGNIQEIPAPKSGMGYDSNSDTEVTNLVSGGRSVYRAPVAFKTFNMTWASSADRLRHLIDLYNGQFGPGPFYFTDPTASQENVLPARWSNAWQLAHQSNGWCRPVIDTDDGIPLTPLPTVYRTDRYVKFTQATAGTVKTEGVVRTRLIRVPGKAYYLSVSGAATGGAAIKVKGFSSATNTWTTLSTFTTFTGATVNVLADTNTNITMLELDLYLPLSSTLTLKGIALGTVDHSAVLNILQTNLALNPRSVGAAYTTNGAEWTTSTVTGLSATPSGVTTATKSIKASGTSPQILSVFNIEGQTNSATVRSIGAWFRPTVSGYQAHYSGTGITSTPVILPANVWTWVTATGYTGYVGAYVTRTDGASANLTDFAYLTGVTCVAGTVAPSVHFDGSTPDNSDLDRYYRWTGTINNSSSVMTDQIPTDWMPVGQGVGALQFGDNTGGELVSSAIDRIGLSLDFTEVQNVESLML